MSEYGDQRSKQVELVPGTLRGYRAFNVHGFFEEVVLESLTSNYLWAPGIQRATCNPSGVQIVSRFADHISPDRQCSCGFYAGYMGVPREYKSHAIYGVLKFSGRIILGDRGFKAEKAEIEALCINSGFGIGRQEIGSKLSEYYKVPMFDSEAELMQLFPPHDVSSLLGHQPCSHDAPFDWGPHLHHLHLQHFQASFTMTIEASKEMAEEMMKLLESTRLPMDWLQDNCLADEDGNG